jgi:hypothetical protein
MSDDERRELTEALDELAHWTRVYYLMLVEHGFTEEDALVVAALWSGGFTE